MRLAMWCALCVALAPALAHAGPTQNDVFKSIQDSVGNQRDVSYKPVILLAVGGAVVTLVLAGMSRREHKKVVVPAALNHSGKLAREVLREVQINAVEMKQLKMLADSIRDELGETPDPLTLLLCPSLLARGVKANPAKLDRRAVAQVVKKMRLNEINPQP